MLLPRIGGITSLVHQTHLHHSVKMGLVWVRWVCGEYIEKGRQYTAICKRTRLEIRSLTPFLGYGSCTTLLQYSRYGTYMDFRSPLPVLFLRASIPPFTWTPQKWVEPGFNPLYTFHMRTLNRVQPAFYTRVQPTSKGGLNSHLSEFEVLEKNGRSRTNADQRRNPSCAERLERGQYPKAAPGFPLQRGSL